MAPDESVITKKFSAIVDLDDDEQRWLRSITGPHRSASPRRDVIQAGRAIPFVAVVQNGWLFRYRRRVDGRRQILSFVLPGDIIGLHRRVVPVSQHSVHSVTPVRMATISDMQISVLAAEHPRLMEAMFWLSAQESSMLAMHTLRLGRMSARERLAHILLELWTRLSWVGQTEGESFFFPITQEMLADALGLSVMHIHRMLRDLQATQLIAIEDRWIRLRDRESLAELAEFDPQYLVLGRRSGG